MRRLIVTLAVMAGLFPAIAAAQAPPPVPALPDAERRTSYSLSASTCACSVGFALYGDSTDVDAWLEVWISGVRYLSSDSTHGWAITSATGPLATIPRPITNAVLTFNSAQTGTVQIVGARRPRRTSQFSGGVAARDLNQVITDLVAQNRETWDKTNDVTGRALLGLPGETIVPMPAAADRANKCLQFDATGLIPQFATCGSGGGGGTVTGPVSSTDNAIARWNGTAGTAIQNSGVIVDDSNNITGVNTLIVSGNGAASAPTGKLSGTWFTGGSSTTTKPQFLIEPSGTTSNGWSTPGTGLGVNAASGFTGKLLDLHVAGTSVLSINYSGALVASGTILAANTITSFSSLATGVISGNNGSVNFYSTGGGTVTILAPATASTFNLVLPTSAGTSGQPLLSGGGSTMTFGSRSGNTTTFATTTGTLTSGDCVKIDASGNLVANGSACGSGSGGITVGTTTITSGTNTRILRNNAGVVGEYTITGAAGSVVMSNGPTLTGTAAFASLTATGQFIFNSNLSSSAWTTTGVRLIETPGTMTDLTSSGTVTAAYTDAFGGDTIAAISSTTYTNYYGSYFKAPVAGSNVTFTNGWALGADSLKVNGAATITGAVTITSGSISGVTLSGASFALGGATSGVITFLPQAVAGTYNFNLPTGAGTAGQAMLSGGGGSAAMTFGTLGVAAGGSGLTAGTSGGVLAFTASGTLASSAALTANLPVIGGGAGAVPSVGTRSGNTTAFVTTTGAQTSGDCVKIDANGNHVANGSTCGSGGGGSPGGSDTQVQYNNAGSFGGSANLTWVSPKLMIGAAGSVVGQLAFANATSGTITLQATTGALGSVTITIPAATDTLALLGTAQTFTAQNIHNVASTITSATAAALDDWKVSAATTTITGNTGSPITRLAKVGLYQPTLTDSSAVTVTDAATLYIDNAPAAAGSVTITNAWALLVGTGATKLQATTINGTLTTNVTGSTQCLHVNTSGVVSGTGSDCGSGGSSTITANSTVTSGFSANQLIKSDGSVVQVVTGITNTGTGQFTRAGAANTSYEIATGGSNTGSNSVSMIDRSWTLNTTGSPNVVAWRITDTARGASTQILNILTGASGTTSVFTIDRNGKTVVANDSGLPIILNPSSIAIEFVTANFAVGIASSELFLKGNSSTPFMSAGSAGAKIGANTYLAWTAETNPNAGTAELFLKHTAAATLQQGNTDADTNAAVVAQNFRTQGLLAGGTSNQAGKNYTILVSPGKGTGAGGSFIVQTAPAGSTGTTVNAGVTALTIDSTGLATFASNLTASGATILFPALGNTATTSAVCYNTSTGLLTYNSTVGTCTVSKLSAKNLLAPLSPREGYEVVMAMEAWRYEMKPGLPTYTPGEQIGFVADYVKDRRLVAYGDNGGAEGMRYEQYTAALTAAFQYFDARLAALRADNDNLRASLSRASGQ